MTPAGPSPEAFARLAPYIQRYIWRQGWTDLRPIQAQATAAVLDGDGHLLIASATASGKTEAAFLPVLTALHDHPSASVGALYVGPLKALINDQFERLDGLLAEADVPVTSWHGDASDAGKARLRRAPRGVVQITPESLESMLLRHPAVARALFCDLRFVVVDEVHAFLGSDRGAQLQCLLVRLERLAGVTPRRIGLSATLGDVQQAADWLAAASSRAVEIIEDHGAGRRLQLAVEAFDVGDEGSADSSGKEALHASLYAHAVGRKSLVFCASRGMVETTCAALRQEAEVRGEPDIFHAHHGSLSAALRHDAERAMRDAPGPACTVATVTLELGVDLGALERVLQVEAPSSVSSLVQRLGRTGRRGDPAQMLFYALRRDPGEHAGVHERLPWDLLVICAQLELYLRERWVESAPDRALPVSLLVHQTLALLKQWTELTPRMLAAELLTLPPFARVGADRLKVLLRFMIAQGLVERSGEGGLLLGGAGERIMDHWSSCAVFEDQIEVQVFDGSRHVGGIGLLPAPGEVFALAGSNWRALQVDGARRRVQATQVKGRGRQNWVGSGAGIDSRVMGMVRDLLSGTAVPAYLRPDAQAALSEARQAVQEVGLLRGSVHALGVHETLLLPWQGTAVTNAVQEILRLSFIGPQGSVRHFMVVPASRARLAEVIARLPDEAEVVSALVDAALSLDVRPGDGRYGAHAPVALLSEAYVRDTLDVSGALLWLRGLLPELSAAP